MPNSFLDGLKWPLNTLAGYMDPMTPASAREPFRNWLTGPVARHDGSLQPVRGDTSSLASVLNSLIPQIGLSDEENIERTLGFMLPAGGIGAAKNLARGPVPESVVNAIGGGAGRRGATRKDLDTARRNATEMLGLPKNNTRADRAQALAHVDKPLWRGGRPPNEAGEMGNQFWFSRDKKTAQGHADKDPRNELGRYVMLKGAEAFPANSMQQVMRHDDAMGIAEALRKDGYTDLATDFESAARDGDLPLALAAKSLEMQIGEWGVRKYLGAIDFDAVDDGRHIAVTNWKRGVMRDPDRAAFDPARLGDPSIYAGLAGVGALNAFINPETGDGLY